MRTHIRKEGKLYINLTHCCEQLGLRPQYVHNHYIPIRKEMKCVLYHRFHKARCYFISYSMIKDFIEYRNIEIDTSEDNLEFGVQLKLYEDD